MSLLAPLLLLQIALGVGAGLCILLEHAGLPPRARLWLHRGLLLLALAAPLLVRPTPAPWTPPAALRTAGPAGERLELSVALPGPAAPTRVALPRRAVDLAGAAALLLVLLGAARTLRAGHRLRRRIAGTHPWRRVGPVQVRIGPPGQGPYAARTPFIPVVVLDPATASDDHTRRLALRHELQHHAQGDAAFAWLWLAVEGALGWNPAIGIWRRLAGAVEEQACDAAVVRHPTVSARAYGRLLLSMATRTPAPAGAAGLPARSPLHQRLSMLAHPTPARPARTAALGLAAAAVLLLATGAARHGAAEVPAATVHAAAPAGLPLGLAPHHAVVAASRARFEGRSAPFFAAAEARRGGWAPLVDGALADAGLPAWLAAVPLVESGYTNWGAADAPAVGSAAPGAVPGRGLWMFIAPTARSEGLRVDDTLDERLDPAAETAAAVALLGRLHAEFGDWRLALAAYNEGPQAVRAAIRAGGTRDPWALVEGGWLNRYSADVVAAAQLMRAR